MTLFRGGRQKSSGNLHDRVLTLGILIISSSPLSIYLFIVPVLLFFYYQCTVFLFFTLSKFLYLLLRHVTYKPLSFKLSPRPLIKKSLVTDPNFNRKYSLPYNL